MLSPSLCRVQRGRGGCLHGLRLGRRRHHRTMDKCLTEATLVFLWPKKQHLLEDLRPKWSSATPNPLA